MKSAAEVDGWKVLIEQPSGLRKNYHVEASDTVWGKFAETFGATPTEALERLAVRTGIDRVELLQMFGL